MEEDKRLITDIAIFFVSVVVMIFWLFINHINVYENKFIGIIAEVLWLPMILLIFVLPILTFVLVSSRKFKNSKILTVDYLIMFAIIPINSEGYSPPGPTF